MRLGTRPVLQLVIDRLRMSQRIDEVLIATTIQPEDLPVVRCALDANARVFCGSEDDVLDRFWQAAKLIRPDNIVRITADCPLIDPDIIDAVIDEHAARGADYTSNTIVATWPDGLDVEVMRFTALERAWQQATLLSEREHVTPYIKNHPEMFAIAQVQRSDDLSHLRWTIDEPADFELIQHIVDSFDPAELTGVRTEHVLKLLDKHPEWLAINSTIQRDEGYWKSVEQDRME